MLKKIDWLVVVILIIYPALLIYLGTSYAYQHGIGWFEGGLFIAGYYGSNISVGLGLHRLWSHNSYKTNKVVEFILALISAGTLQGPALAWASDHYKHHTFTDKEQDPHTPFKFKNRLLGFFWSHIGWMLYKETNNKSLDRITIVKLGRNKILAWQMKYYWQLAIFMNTIIPMLIGYLFGWSILAAYGGFLFIGLGRALQQQATFCVNSACHFLGSKLYFKGTAGDIWWLALFLLGENWHNFHHAFPSDYRNGVKWYHFDVHKWLIYLMSKSGLAWDLERTAEIRIQAKATETLHYLLEGRKQQLSVIQSRIEQLTQNLTSTLSEVENSSIIIRKKVQSSFAEIHESLYNLAQQLHSSSMQLCEKSSDKFIKVAAARISKTEAAIAKLYREFKES